MGEHGRATVLCQCPAEPPALQRGRDGVGVADPSCPPQPSPVTGSECRETLGEMGCQQPGPRPEAGRCMGGTRQLLPCTHCTPTIPLPRAIGDFPQPRGSRAAPSRGEPAPGIAHPVPSGLRDCPGALPGAATPLPPSTYMGTQHSKGKGGGATGQPPYVLEGWTPSISSLPQPQGDTFTR